MKIAILGASSLIARDLTHILKSDRQLSLFLYGRDAPYLEYDSFMQHDYDVVINFVGSGNPQKTAELGAAILDITAHYDQLAIEYLHKHPQCRYIFLSSGAAFGDNFEQPVSAASHAVIHLNHLRTKDWYSIAKMYAEIKHRALDQFAITDVRVFSYFSMQQNLADHFLICDMLRAIQTDSVFTTSADSIIRDYITPSDFHQMIRCILQAPPRNMALDCYSKAPVEKHRLIEVMQNHFGLKVTVIPSKQSNATSQAKSNYYSLNRSAEKLGYLPQKTSIEGIVDETTKLFAGSGFKK